MNTDDALPSGLQRIALQVEYDGSGFSGWQRQAAPELPTVQQAIETALGRIADHEVNVVCAGRTDAGVHATHQIIHFDAQTDRGEKAWVVGSNSLLPKSVRVLRATPVPAEFHARFSAVSRRYHYVLIQRRIAPALLQGQVTQVMDALDVGAMHAAAQALLGEQDFTSFRAAGCQSNTPNRCILRANVEQRGSFVVLDIEANAFLQHMVRNIVGSLLEIGLGRQPASWIAELLGLRDRTVAAMTAPPDGLYLVGVGYPGQFDLPVGPTIPLFLTG